MRTEIEQRLQKINALKSRIISHLNAEGAMDKTGHRNSTEALYYLFQNGESNPYEFKAFTVELMASLLKHPEIAQQYSTARSHVDIDKYFECLYFFFEALDESKTFHMLMEVKGLENRNPSEQEMEKFEEQLNELEKAKKVA